MELLQAHITSVLCNVPSQSFMNIEVVLLLITYLGDNSFEKVRNHYLCNYGIEIVM